jgi:hypothetical protein
MEKYVVRTKFDIYVFIINHGSPDTLGTWQMVPKGTSSLPAEISTQ